MEEKFFMMASFEFTSDVQILKGKLESEGIPVFLRDENTLNSDPLISHAIGGVKLKVRAYAIDKEGNPIVCPNCKAKKSEAYYNRKTIFYKLFPFFEAKKYKCLNCGIITKPD